MHRHSAFPLALSSLDAGRFRNRVHLAMHQARCDRAIDRRRPVSPRVRGSVPSGPPLTPPGLAHLNRVELKGARRVECGHSATGNRLFGRVQPAEDDGSALTRLEVRSPSHWTISSGSARRDAIAAVRTAGRPPRQV